MRKVNPLIYLMGGAILAPMLAIFLMVLGVPGGVVGPVVFFSILICAFIIGAQLKRKK